MTRTRTLLTLTLALAALLGLALAQGMMGVPGDPSAPGNGDGPGYGRGPASGYGMMQPGPGGFGHGGMGTMRHGFGGHGFGGHGYGGHGSMGGPMMRGGTMGGATMHGGMMRVLPPDAEPLDDAELRARLDAAARTLGPDVEVHDVMPFTDHSYAQLVASDGAGLAEVLVDRYSGVVTPEPGPNMMWNLRTGMGSGMGYGMGYGMGRGMGSGMGSMPGIGPDQRDRLRGAPEERYDRAEARELASAFLGAYLPGAEILAGQTFPGYVTFDYGRDGRIEGMFSVHLVTGEVWPHTWHGAYRGETGAHDD